MLELKLVIYGKVQELSYRSHILDFIDQKNLLLKGRISPLPNGSLQIIAQSDIETLKEFRAYCLEGHTNVAIRDVEEVISPISEYTYSDFSISYDED